MVCVVSSAVHSLGPLLSSLGVRQLVKHPHGVAAMRRHELSRCRPGKQRRRGKACVDLRRGRHAWKKKERQGYGQKSEKEKKKKKKKRITGGI